MLVKRGIVSGGAAVIWYDTGAAKVEGVFAIARYDGGYEEVFTFNDPEACEDRCFKVWLPINDNHFLRTVRLYFRDMEKIKPFSYDYEKYYLDRTLSKTTGAVNSNIRWSGRIEDFDTRIFSAYQSYRYLKASNISLALQCLISVSYTSIEYDRAIDCERIKEILLSEISAHIAEIEGAVRSSLLCALVHLSIFTGDKDCLEHCATLHREMCAKDVSYIWNGYNASISTLFIGYYLLSLGRLSEASEAFGCWDFIHKALAEQPIEHLNDCRERVAVTSWLYMCRVGEMMAAGQSVEAAPDLPSPELSLESLVVHNVHDCQRIPCRIWGDRGRHAFLSRFAEIINNGRSAGTRPIGE